MGGRQAYRHAKAGWQRRRQEIKQNQAKKQSLASRQTAKQGQVKAARDRSRQAEALV
jgi:hypothetical protein